MFQRFATAFLAVGLLVAAPVALQAQNEGFGLEGSAGVFIPGGDDFEDLDSGFGFEGIASWAWASGLEIGAGFGRSSHDFTEDSEDFSLDVTRIFGEVVYRFNSVPTNSVVVMPYIGARGGYTRVSADIDDAESLNGSAFGGVAGFEIWLSEGFAIIGKGTLDFVTLEAFEDEEEGSSGTLIGILGGLKVRVN